eukprot:TRINITY_DN34898_c0_g1_i1.p1 TRINITY_DN34898_c0_g1~~TRINITY_DN34898_c0_g1_i1.p1  ORF type:complete len:651 (-),score=144.73 TRINITY_DN34898_c0_g1_i1:78-2030(-)
MAAPGEMVEDRSHEDPAVLLIDAARAGDVAKVQEYVQAGADISTFDDWGLQPLHSAAVGGHVEAAASLLDLNAHLDAPSRRGQTALHLAAHGGQEGVAQLLIQRRADVCQPTGHGIMAYELAQKSGHAGTIEIVRQEVERRYHLADQDFEELKRRVSVAENARETLEAQLRGGPAPPKPPPVVDPGPLPAASIFDAAVDGAHRSKGLIADPHGGYWQRASALLSHLRLNGEASIMGSFMREPKPESEGSDNFPWTGTLVADSPFPQLNPADPGLDEGLARLELVAREKHHREAGRSMLAAGDEELEDDILAMAMDLGMDEQTGRSQSAWEELVTELKAPEATWDWSKLEVRELPESQEGSGVRFGVFAAEPSQGEDSNDEEDTEGGVSELPTPAGEQTETVAFCAGDVIGPLGGLLLRKSHFEKEHYGKQCWRFHDPQAHDMHLRAMTAELKTEPLVLDFGRGTSQNRLKYIRDIRRDPLGMVRHLPVLKAVTAQGQEDDVYIGLPDQRRPRQRVRSRPTSPMNADRMSATIQETEKQVEHALSQLHYHEEDHTNLPSPNVRIVEVHVHGWPYAFMVATSEILTGEELRIDHGEEYWATQKQMLARLVTIGKITEEIVLGVTKPPDPPADPFPPRQPKPRANSRLGNLGE